MKPIRIQVWKFDINENDVLSDRKEVNVGSYHNEFVAAREGHIAFFREVFSVAHCDSRVVIRQRVFQTGLFLIALAYAYVFHDGIVTGVFTNALDDYGNCLQFYEGSFTCDESAMSVARSFHLDGVDLSYAIELMSAESKNGR